MAAQPQSKVRIICVPTEAGTHFPGQSKAPEALLKTGGLEAKLKEADYEVTVDADALAGDELKAAAAWRPAPKIEGVRNEDAAVQVLQALHAHLTAEANRLPQDTFPLVLGGDCSITPAVLSALHASHPPDTYIGLIYFDGDVDLTLPESTGAPGESAILDSMCMTHLTGRRGGLDSMRAFCGKDDEPLVSRDNVVLFGFDPLEPKPEHWMYLLEKGFKAFGRPTVNHHPVDSAKEAIEWLAERVDVIYLHFDVDSIDSGAFPLANYPHYGGLGVDEAFAALKTFLSESKVRGCIVTEVNPNNDPQGEMVTALVDAIVEGMSGRKED